MKSSLFILLLFFVFSSQANSADDLKNEVSKIIRFSLPSSNHKEAMQTKDPGKGQVYTSEDGKVIGIMIHKISPNSIFAELDLQAGDILVRYEDEALDSREQLKKFFDFLKNNSSFEIYYYRNNKLIQMKVNKSQLPNVLPIKIS